VKAERAAYAHEVARMAIQQMKFIDECGSHLGLTRLYGRAQPGQRVVEATPGYSGQHYTLVASLSVHGVEAPIVIEGAMNSTVFEAYIRDVFAPTLQPGDIVGMDNLSAHTAADIEPLIAARGAQLVYLPPYSPDLNPIEKCWAKLKAFLRAAKARTFDDLIKAIATALRAVSTQDALNWFRHCGYPVC
jgi:transposase